VERCAARTGTHCSHSWSVQDEAFLIRVHGAMQVSAVLVVVLVPVALAASCLSFRSITSHAYREASHISRFAHAEQSEAEWSGVEWSGVESEEFAGPHPTPLTSQQCYGVGGLFLECCHLPAAMNVTHILIYAASAPDCLYDMILRAGVRRCI
jgi:hypothetical protein